MNNPALRFQSLLAQAISQSITILGPDITYATLIQIPEIKLDPSGKIIAIEGVDQEIVNKLLTSFTALAPEVTNQHIAPLFSSYTQAEKVDGTTSLASLPNYSLPEQSTFVSPHFELEHRSDESIYRELC